MNKVDNIKTILGIGENDFRRGVATVCIDYKKMEKLNTAELLNMSYVRKYGPSVREFYDFMEKYKEKDIEVRLTVIDPRREDFRIGVQVLSVGSQYAKIRTEEDMMFWRDFMAFGKQGEACMIENEDYVSWTWYE